jgi:hypothetical protein
VLVTLGITVELAMNDEPAQAMSGWAYGAGILVLFAVAGGALLCKS